jgi:hypothetical protein
MPLPLNDKHRGDLAQIANSSGQMEALEALADAIKLDVINKIKPPATLDQYGATVGAAALLRIFLEEIEISRSV